MQAATQTAKPGKQRKALFQAPDHIRHKNFAALLSPELRKSHGTRSLPVRSGDTVRVMRGDHKGFEGKVTRVDKKKFRIYVEGLTREKVDGTTIFVPVHPSKVMITKLNLDDKWRKKILERRKVKKEKVEEKPVEKRPEAVKVEEKPLEKKEEIVELPAPEKKPKRKRKVASRKPEKESKEKPEEGKKEKKPKTRTKARKKKTVEEAP